MFFNAYDINKADQGKVKAGDMHPLITPGKPLGSKVSRAVNDCAHSSQAATATVASSAEARHGAQKLVHRLQNFHLGNSGTQHSI